MNPQFDQTPGLHLPQPGNNNQQAGYNPPFYGAPMPGAPVPQFPGGNIPKPVYQQPLQQPSAAPAQQAPQPQPAAIAPAPPQAVAEDGEGVGDEEWVEKAREITLRYRSDPYMQSKELSRLKAQYVKARYNKDVKVNEDRQ